MEYNLWFNFCAAVVLAELLVLYYMKFNAPFQKYTIFLCLLWCAMISTLSSITNNLLPGHAPLWVIRTSNVVYFVAHGMIPPGLFLYVYSLTDYNLQDVRQVVPWLIPSGFGLLVVLTSGFSNTVFQLDASGGYHRGPLMPLIYLITAYHFCITLFALYRYRRVIPSRERNSICVFLGLASAAMLFQLLRPHMLVENFACAVCLVFSQLTVQNPEMILDGRTGMLNKQGFSNLLAPKFDAGHSFHIGFLVVDNYHELERLFGFECLEKKLLVLADYLKQHTDYTFSRMDNHVFCFYPNAASSGADCSGIIRDLESDQLFGYLKQEGVGVRFRIKAGIFTCPEDVASFGALIELLDETAKLPSPREAAVSMLSAVDILTLRRRKQIDELVRRAVSEDMLYLVYQPVYSVSEGRFISAEALLRMRTDSLGSISPGEFIQIAEQNGAIVQLTQFVVDSVCRFLQSANLKALNLQRIHINLSALDCMQHDLAARILESLRRTGVGTEMLSVEITETAFVSMPDHLLESLESLSQAGISVMLDDYGTGYSNLSRLVFTPFDVVKLDKSLVDDIIDSEPSRIILENTIHMMKRLHKKILVEGVENKAQAEFLREQGCDFIQGYYYARPMDGPHLEALLREQMQNG